MPCVCVRRLSSVCFHGMSMCEVYKYNKCYIYFVSLVFLHIHVASLALSISTDLLLVPWRQLAFSIIVHLIYYYDMWWISKIKIPQDALNFRYYFSFYHLFFFHSHSLISRFLCISFAPFFSLSLSFFHSFIFHTSPFSC